MKKRFSLLMCLCMLLASFSLCAPIKAHADIIYGDPDGDSNVMMNDVIMMQKHIAKLLTLKDTAFKSADVTAPYNEITMTDVTEVQKYIAKLIKSFPAQTENVSTDSDSSESDSENASDTDILSDTEDTREDSDIQSDSPVIIDGVLTLAQAREYGDGVFLTLRGQVVYVYGGNTVILEEVNDGVVTSYQIFDKNGVAEGKYPLNSIVDVTGTTSYYIGTLQISSPEKVVLYSQNNSPIPPVESKIDELADCLSTKVIIKGVTILSNENGSLEVGRGSKSVKAYRPTPLPDGIGTGSVIDLVCVPYIYDGNVQIRVAYTSDYTLSQEIPDSEADNTDTGAAPSDTQSDTDTSGSSDSEFKYDGLYRIFDANEDNISSLASSGYLILTSGCYAVSGQAEDGSLAGLEFLFDSNDGYAMAESKSTYIIESDGNGNYYLKNMYLGKYISATSDSTATVFTDEPSGSVMLSVKDNGTLLITDVNTGRYLGFKETGGKTLFRWYKSKSSACEITVYTQAQ